MILIFGAAGFIGTYLIDELLERNYQIIAADISLSGESYYREKDIPYIKVDITDKSSFKQIPQMKYKAVINLACVQPANVSADKYDPVDYINVNTIGTLNILDYIRKVEAEKFIYVCSHRNTQGFWYNSSKAIREENGRSLKYKGEYAMFSISESAAQDCVEYYHKQYGLKCIMFRLPPVYGYGPHTEIYMNGKPVKTGFQIFIENAMSCRPIEIWGDSSKGRDIIYIKDVVTAFIKAFKSDKAFGLYNIASGKMLTLKEEAEIIAEVFWGDNTNPRFVERPEIPNSIESYVYNISKAKSELNWMPQYDFKTMMLDYKKEMKSKKFSYLVEKRKIMLKEG